MPTHSAENLYRLVIACTAGPDESRLLTFTLHGDGGRVFADAQYQLEVGNAMLDRLAILCSRPHLAPDVLAADPAHVGNVASAAVDDIACWLWQKLPQPIQDELSTRFQRPVRLLVEAHGDAALLPWHRLAAWNAAEGTVAQPQAAGHWTVAMHVDGGDVGDTLLQPEVLLVVGSQTMRVGNDRAEYEVRKILQSIRDAGFACSVVAGAPIVVAPGHGIDGVTVLDSVRQIAQHIAASRASIVHFIGHSDADPDRKASSAQGASTVSEVAARPAQASVAEAKALVFEFSGRPTPEPMSAIELRQALRQCGARLVVLHACLTREFLPRQLLGKMPSREGMQDGVVDAVIAMAAMAPPPVCATFAAEFYKHLQAHKHVPAAFFEASRAVEKDHSRYASLPIQWTRVPHALRLADERDQRLQAYCAWVRQTQRDFEGLFATDDFDNVFDEVVLDLDLEMSRDDKGPVHAGHALVRAKEQAGVPQRCSDLVAAGGWWSLGGGPGSGKTTALRKQAWMLAGDPTMALVPIYLALPGWLQEAAAAIRAKKPIQDWLYAHVATANFQEPALAADLEQCAEERRLVLLLDGYDELSFELRQLLTEPQGVFDRLALEGGVERLLVATRRYQSARRLGRRFADANLQDLQPSTASQLLRNLIQKAERPEGRMPAAQVDAHVAQFDRDLHDRVPLWTMVGKAPLWVALFARQLLDVHQVPGGEHPAKSRHEFFELAFDVLCRGRHRKNPTELPHRQDALVLLRHVALQLTKSQNRTASLAQFEQWLAAPELATQLGDRGKWLPTIDRTETKPPSPAAAFLRRVAADTLILQPETERPGARWRFWHRSFQEALCAEALHLRFLAGRDEGEGAEALMAEVGASLEFGGDRAAAVRRMREQVQAEFDQARTSKTEYSSAQLDMITEGRSAPTDNTGDRNMRFNRLRGEAFFDACLDELAKARVVAEALEPWAEALALIADQQESPHALLRRVQATSWWIAWRATMASTAVDVETVALLLETLPELNQRAALVAHAASAVASDGVDDLLARLRTRTAALWRWMQPLGAEKERVGQPDLGQQALARRSVWDAPGELSVLAAAGEEVLRRSAVRAVDALATLGAADPTLTAALKQELRFVPRRAANGRKLLPTEATAEGSGMHLWRRIPAGTFRMGMLEGGPRGDEVLHEHAIDEPFWIAAVPVTVGLYRVFSPQHWVWVGNGYKRVDDPSVDPDTAVGCVSHHAASLFCRWLQRHAGSFLAEHLGVTGEAAKHLQVRLPTEAEWEYAARAGSETAYCFGEDPSQLRHWGWHGEDRMRGAPHAVALLEGHAGAIPGAPASGANKWGLFDVHGNVWEWCSDWYGRSAAKTANSGRFRVQRGGSFRDDVDYCRSSYRYGDVPDDYGDDNGFRLVVSVPQLGH